MDKKIESFYDDRHDIFKKPQTYKNIEFYPLKISEYGYIDFLNKLFMYPKRYYGMKSPEIFKISYLKFILVIIQESFAKKSGIDLEESLIEFLKHITRKKDVGIEYDVRGNSLDKVFIRISIDGEVFSESDFDIMRSLILRQNGISVEYVEEYNEGLESDLEFVNRNKEPYTYKDRVFAFAALNKKTIEEIKDCTLYEMENLLECHGGILSYGLQTIPLTEVDHDKYEFISFLVHLKDKSRYGEIVSDIDEFKKTSTLFKSDAELVKK
jgi:hypothetical protein